MKNTELIKFAQIIPSEMLQALQQSATEKGISLELEIASRLLVTFTAPESFSLNPLIKQLMLRKFSEKEAIAECKRKRLGNQYLYELEKLRTYLRFKNTLPRTFKENFMLIDVKAASKKIHAELARGA